MSVAISSAARQAEQNAIVNQIGSGATLVILDSNGNTLLSYGLAGVAATAYQDVMFFSGLPADATVSNNALVGVNPASASVLTSSGYAVITGIPIATVTSFVVLTSSGSVNPGDPVRCQAAQISFKP